VLGAFLGIVIWHLSLDLYAEIALVVLIGPSGSGKSVWAAEHYRPHEVVSSDRLRAVVGSGEHDLDASADAFALLDHIVAARLRRGLTAEGFVVDVAHDGVDGLHLAREGEYDAVVLDLMLPGLSGYQVCERLRAERNWVPVLILSAKDGEYDQADGLDLGADDYMTKPFSYVVLAARLRALLRRGARPRPAVLAAGDLHLDPAARTVRRAEADIELTAREFALLEYLMRRAGQVVSKAELLEHVWDADSVTDMNVVEVYAGYLRRKIDRPFEVEQLETVRGAGYRLLAAGSQRGG